MVLNLYLMALVVYRVYRIYNCINYYVNVNILNINFLFNNLIYINDK